MSFALIDLHSHTNESDGTFSPEQLIEEAVRSGVDALGVTDHDTFAGYDAAREPARREVWSWCAASNFPPSCTAIRCTCWVTFRGQRTSGIREWVEDLQASRRERNVRLAGRLRELGIDITVEEAEARGRGMTGRPHFAQIMVEKGYVSNLRQAFDEYLDESAKGYVFRREPQFSEAVERIRAAGGIASLAHPIRVRGDVPALLPELCDAGLNAIEAYHSDHGARETGLYLELARKYGLLVTGGSDFHGELKPEIRLGTGCGGNLRVPREVLEKLRAQ